MIVPTWFLITTTILIVIHESRYWIQMLYEISCVEEAKEQEKTRERELNEITRHMYI